MRRTISVLSTRYDATGPAFHSPGKVSGRLAEVGTLQAQLLAAMRCDYVVEEIPIEGSDQESWRRLACRCEHWLSKSDSAGVIVAHELDALNETAYFLHRVLSCSGRPVVLTCTKSLATPLDPSTVLAEAQVVATAQGAQGVVVVRDGAIYAGAEILDDYSMSDDFGLLGAEPIGFVVGNDVEILRRWPAPAPDASHCFKRCMTAADWPRVEIVVNHAGSDGELVRELIRGGVAGIVAVGLDGAPVHRGLEESLLYAVEGGIGVVRSAALLHGCALPHSLKNLPASRELTPQKARIDLLLALLESRSSVPINV